VSLLYYILPFYDKHSISTYLGIETKIGYLCIETNFTLVTQAFRDYIIVSQDIRNKWKRDILRDRQV